MTAIRNSYRDLRTNDSRTTEHESGVVVQGKGVTCQILLMCQQVRPCCSKTFLNLFLFSRRRQYIISHTFYIYVNKFKIA